MRLLWLSLGLIGCLALTSFSRAEPLLVNVLDHNGKPFIGAVVELKHPELTSAHMGIDASKPAIMDQVDKQFRPYVLAVPQNSPVIFPNSDSIKHHGVFFFQT